MNPTCCNHRVEADQSLDIIFVKYDPVLLKLFDATYERASLSFIFRSSESRSKLHNIALTIYKVLEQDVKMTSNLFNCKYDFARWSSA